MGWARQNMLRKYWLMGGFAAFYILQKVGFHFVFYLKFSTFVIELLLSFAYVHLDLFCVLGCLCMLRFQFDGCGLSMLVLDMVMLGIKCWTSGQVWGVFLVSVSIVLNFGL